MQARFDVRKYLKIDDDRPVELRICHIADLWYKAVLSKRMKNHLDTIYNLFPDLVIVEGDRTGKAGDRSPEYDFKTNYITAYRKGGYLLQGAGDVVQIVNCLYGSVNSPKQSGPAKEIQIRVSGELCRDISLLTGIRSHYTRLILGLSPKQLDEFKNVFAAYINAIMDDLGKYPSYRTQLFPFSSDRLVLELNNYLSREFEAGNYADFFLWMNLGALLRNEINGLIDTYDSSFELRQNVTAPSPEGGAKRGIPRCLTKIPPVSQTVGLVGREDVKAAVRSMLEERGRMALVSGLGGIGKTAVMQYVCNDLKEEGKYVAWIDCGDSLKRDLLGLGAALGIDTGDPDSAYEQVLLAVKTRLDGDVYLFLDDLKEDLTREELGDLNSLNAHIMVTSRKVYDAFPTVGLEVLSDDSAVTMFFRYYNGDTDRRYEDAARRTVSSVGRHTLLVELLARAAKRSGGTLEDFNTWLEAEGVYDVFRRKIDTAHDEKMTIEDCVIRLYETSSLSDVQKHIMRLFSIFTPGKEIYYKVSEWAGLDMDAMDELIDMGWIETSGPENNYKIHQVIRDSMALQMRRQGKRLRIEDYGALLKRVADTGSYMPRDLEYTKLQERIVLAEDVAEYLAARLSDKYTEESKGMLVGIAHLFNNIARMYTDQWDYARAYEYCRKALSIAEYVFGEEQIDTAYIYHNMAIVLRHLEDFVKAHEYLKKALSITKLVLGNKHTFTAMIYQDMAEVFMLQESYDIAFSYYKKALVIREIVLGKEHPDTADIYAEMSSVLLYQKEYGKALEYDEKALGILERVRGKDHFKTARCYHNMAFLSKCQKNYDKALDYFEKSMEFFERFKDRNPLYLANEYRMISEVYTAKDDYAKALEYREKELVILVRVRGKEHRDIAISFHNMGFICSKQGKYDKAIKYYEKALEIKEHVYGKDHSFNEVTYNNLANVYHDIGDYTKACEYYKRSLAILERVQGKEHWDTANAYYIIGLMYSNKEDYVKALEYYKEALDILERLYGKVKYGANHPSIKVTVQAMEKIRNLLLAKLIITLKWRTSQVKP